MTLALLNHVLLDELSSRFVVMRVQMGQLESIPNPRLEKRLGHAHAVVDVVRAARPFVALGAEPFFRLVAAAAGELAFAAGVRDGEGERGRGERVDEGGLAQARFGEFGEEVGQGGRGAAVPAAAFELGLAFVDGELGGSAD